MKSKTYTVVSRDPNSWLRTTSKDCHHIIYKCGHCHRTLKGAIKCMASVAGTTLAINANVEHYVTNQLVDGEPVEQGREYHAAEQEAFWATRRI